MEIRIVTDGDASRTTITLNGQEWKLSEFNFSIRAGRKAKMQLKRVNALTKAVEFLSFFGEDFRKFDERVESEGLIGSPSSPAK